jgi:hypothetical protein
VFIKKSYPNLPVRKKGRFTSKYSTMKFIRFIAALTLLVMAGADMLYAQQQAQKDAPETLDWVQRRANRIDTMLYGAVISQEPVNLLLKLWGAWQEFDAVLQAGVYCQAARAAAEKGRLECDLLGYERDQDVNAMIARATEARRQAFRMRMAAQACATDSAASIAEDATTFRLSDVLESDARIVELDLADARASKDMHIVVQKLEHAQRILRDIELLTWSLDNCDAVLLAARAAGRHCKDAAAKNTWDEAAPHLEQALAQNTAIKNAAGACR